MQKTIWAILLAVMLTTMAEAADTVKPCKELYTAMPPKVRNYLPALILNAKDKGRDVFRKDTAALIADRTDDCTVIYNYYEQGEQYPATCSETVSFCPVAAPPPAITNQAAASAEPIIDYKAFAKKAMEEKEKKVKAQEEEQRRSGITKYWKDQEEQEEFIEILVTIKADGDKAAVIEGIKASGGELVRDVDKWSPRTIKIKVHKANKQKLIKKLNTNKHVEDFDKNDAFILNSIVPNDSQYSLQGWAPKLGMPDAWGISVGGVGVKVAVLDSGVEILNNGKFWIDLTTGLGNGHNFINDNTNTNDLDFDRHGTIITEVLGSIGNNGDGLAGMSWYGSIIPVVVCIPNSGRDCFADNVVRGIDFAVASGARIINMSFGSTTNNSKVASAIARARASGVVLVAAAGNDGNNVLNYPAAYPGVIGVGGTDTSSSSDQKWSSSNYGTWVDVAAPATQIAAYHKGSYWYNLGGTSYAAPQVAGLAALMLATNPFLGKEDIEGKIFSTASYVPPTGGSPTVQFGRIQPYNALLLALQGARKDGDMTGDDLLSIEDAVYSLDTFIANKPLTTSAMRHGDLFPVVVLSSIDYGEYTISYINPAGDGIMDIRDPLVSLKVISGDYIWPGFVLANPPPPHISGSNFTLSGFMPEGFDINISGADGAIIGPVTYTGPNSWSATVSGLAAGDNVFTVVGMNASGATQSDTALVNFVPTRTIAAGVEHTVALKRDGTAWSWGANWYGQLGDNTTNDSAIPVQASGLSGIATVASGGYHTAALKNDGTVWSWGDNYFGQLGNGTIIDSPLPVQVSGLNGVMAVAGGYLHSLALKNDGTVHAWGDNDAGQLGNEINAYSSIPVSVSSLSGVKAIAGGAQHSVVLKNDGTVWAWGGNGSGQLGNGTTVSSINPVPVSGLSGVKSIAAGQRHTVALKGDGTIWAWGDNGSGQLGNDTTAYSSVPIQANGLSGVTTITAGGSHTAALKNDGTVWAWGNNWVGQLGDGTTTDRLRPVQVNDLNGVVAVAAGEYHTVALKSDGSVWSWGGNFYGQLGISTPDQSASPLQAQTFNVKYASAAYNLGVNFLGTGQGTVSSTPASIACSTNCSAPFSSAN